MAVGLLEDFLEHVVLVVAQLVFFELVFQLFDDGADDRRRRWSWSGSWPGASTAISLSLR